MQAHLANPHVRKLIVNTTKTAALRSTFASKPAPRAPRVVCVRAAAAGEGSLPARRDEASPTLVQRFMQSGFVAAYLRSLEEKPVLTKAVTSLIGFTLGDLVAQHFVGAPYDVLRTVRMSLFGLCVDGPLGHAFYKLIDTNVMPDRPKSNAAVVTKTAIDQLIYAPIGTVLFLAFLTLMEGRPTEIMSVIQAKAGPVLLANYGLWPLVHLLNFKFVPPEQRILFNNSVSILWTTYLSWMCGAPVGGVGGDGLQMLATTLPCATSLTAIHGQHLAQALRETVAVERLLTSWGTQGLPNSDAGTEVIVNYLSSKSELLTKACGVSASDIKYFVP